MLISSIINLYASVKSNMSTLHVSPTVYAERTHCVSKFVSTYLCSSTCPLASVQRLVHEFTFVCSFMFALLLVCMSCLCVYLGEISYAHSHERILVHDGSMYACVFAEKLHLPPLVSQMLRNTETDASMSKRRTRTA